MICFITKLMHHAETMHCSFCVSDSTDFTRITADRTRGTNGFHPLSERSKSVPKHLCCSQAAVSKIWSKYEQSWKVIKHAGRPRKMSVPKDRKQSNMA